MKHLLTLTLLVFALLGYSKDYTTGDGNWTSASTWSKGVQPTTEDTLVIEDGHTVTIDSRIFYLNNDLVLIVKGVLSLDGGQLILTENSTVSIRQGRLEFNQFFSDRIWMGVYLVYTALSGNIEGDYEITKTGTVLPVTWKEVTASNVDNAIQVNWSTATEIDNDFFTVEYSTDTTNWIVAVTVEGSGTTSIESEYSTSFYPSSEGSIYIRIKQTDYNGDSDYSKLVTIEFNYLEVDNIIYYIDLNGNRFTEQPLGLSIAFYESGFSEKVLK